MLGCVVKGRTEKDWEVLSPVTARWNCGHHMTAKMTENGHDLWHRKVLEE